MMLLSSQGKQESEQTLQVISLVVYFQMPLLKSLSFLLQMAILMSDEVSHPFRSHINLPHWGQLRKQN